MQNRKIFFVSDNLQTINNYRSDLFNFLTANNFVCKKFPIKNYFLSLAPFKNDHILIVSNIGSTLSALVLLPFKRKMIILNGLASMKNFKLTRYIFLLLAKINSSTIFVCQNFTEYRYLKKYAKNVTHIVCSGGRKFSRNIKESNKFIVITRKKKFIRTAESINNFLKTTKHDLIVYGIDENYGVIKKEYLHRVQFKGWCERSKFFLESGNFFQPYGHNEGFPHSLADAMCSKCNIVIDENLLIQLGLYRLKSSNNKFHFFSETEYSEISEELYFEKICKKYLFQIENFFSLD